jgi:hypothetical protein
MDSRRARRNLIKKVAVAVGSTLQEQDIEIYIFVSVEMDKFILSKLGGTAYNLALFVNRTRFFVCKFGERDCV